MLPGLLSDLLKDTLPIFARPDGQLDPNLIADFIHGFLLVRNRIYRIILGVKQTVGAVLRNTLHKGLLFELALATHTSSQAPGRP
jgi:hypothetical protein